MPRINIPNSLYQAYDDGIDSLIEGHGSRCLLVFPPKLIPCPNCIFDPNTKRSSGYYKTGGPYFFEDGTICPMCEGNGQQSIESTKEIKLLTEWNPRDTLRELKNYNIQVSSPANVCRTTGYALHTSDVLQCQYIIIDSDQRRLLELKCYKLTEPIIDGLKTTRYMVMWWERR